MITPIGTNIAPQLRRASTAGGAGFQVPADANRASAAPAEQLGGTLPAALLALQEYDPGEGRRRTLRRGQAMLGKLARLQQAILEGAGDEATLRELAELVAAPVEADDPQLRALIGAVQLRARIELAKRQQAQNVGRG